MNRVAEARKRQYYAKLKKQLSLAHNEPKLFQTIVDAPFFDKLRAAHIDLGIVVFLQVNKKTKTIDRIALSNTDMAQRTLSMSAKPFTEIKIPLGYKDNMIAKAIKTGRSQFVTDWKYMFVPALTPDQARLNQRGAGIECSVIVPLKSRDGGAMIFSFFQPPDSFTPEHLEFPKVYAEMVDMCLSIKPKTGLKAKIKTKVKAKVKKK